MLGMDLVSRFDMIIVTIKSEETLNQPADGFVLGTPWGLRCDVFAMEQIPHFRSLTSKPLYLNMERILHPADLDDFKQDLQMYESLVDGIYFSDFGVVQIANELGILNKLIYNPSSLVTNANDVGYLLDQGFQSVCLAKELTLEEIKTIIQHYPIAEVFIHGYMVMFYAKRTVLDNFTTKSGYPKMEQATLTDESREASYPMIEDDHGTNIFQENPLASFEQFSQLQSARLRIDGYLVPEQEHHFVIQCYDDLRQNTPLSAVLKRMEETLPHRRFTSGFYFKKTTYTQAE